MAQQQYGTSEKPHGIEEQDKEEDSCCVRCCCSPWCSGITGTFLLTLGLMMAIWLPGFMRGEIEQQLSLKDPTTILYGGFVNQSSEVNVFYRYSYFNVTNYRDVELHGAKPNLTEHGPYWYERVEWRPEEHISWDASGVLRYKTLYRFHFREDMSPGLSESDVIFQPRAGIFLALQKIFGTTDSAGSEIIDLIIQMLLDLDNIETIFHNRTVYELRHGYVEPFLTPFTALGVSDVVAFGANQLDIDAIGECAIFAGPAYPKSDTINDTEAATIPSDERDPAESNRVYVGQYLKWQGYSELPYWHSHAARMINGSDGSMFPPNIFGKKYFYIFVNNLHRSLLAEHSSDVNFYGITLHRLTLHKPSLESMEVNPANKGFCIFENGLQPLQELPTHCTYENIFGVLGKPYYLDSNTTRVNVTLPRAVNRVLDDSHLDVEPNSGILMRVQNQLMASLLLGPVKFKFSIWEQDIRPFRNLPKTWLPAFTASEIYQMPESLRTRIKLEVLLPLELAKYLGPTLAAVGGLLLIAMVVRWYVVRRQEQAEQRLLEERAALRRANNNNRVQDESSTQFMPQRLSSQRVMGIPAV